MATTDGTKTCKLCNEPIPVGQEWYSPDVYGYAHDACRSKGSVMNRWMPPNVSVLRDLTLPVAKSTNDAWIAALARKYGDAWKAYDEASQTADEAEGARNEFSDATKERLSALAYEQSCAHVALLKALGVKPT